MADPRTGGMPPGSKLFSRLAVRPRRPADAVMLNQLTEVGDAANDLDRLRFDPAFKLACGRLPDSGLDLCSQPTSSRLGNLPDLRTVMRWAACWSTCGYRVMPRHRAETGATVPYVQMFRPKSTPRREQDGLGLERCGWTSAHSAHQRLPSSIDTAFDRADGATTSGCSVLVTVPLKEHDFDRNLLICR